LRNKYFVFSAIILLFGLVILNSCSSKSEKVEKINEDEVEVVLNHSEPYELKGEPGTFRLDEIFVIDLERNDLAAIGLTEIHDFAVDSDGDIYFSDSRGKENLIFKFDASGNFLKSFCRKGQGPGELPRAPSLTFTQDDELVAYSDMKLLIFEPDGSLLREVKTDVRYIVGAYCLENGNYLFVLTRYPQEESEKTSHLAMLYDPNFNEIKELDKIETFPLVVQRIEGITYNLAAEVGNGKIFTGSQQRAYEIYVHDFDGNLTRKIRKDYINVPPSEDYKENFLGMFKGDPSLYEAAKEKIYFPSSMPPYHYFLTDAKGRLYVMTYEKGINPGDYMFDIFNPEGVFVGRKSLKGFSILEVPPRNIKIKNDHFYSIEEKESGFKKFVVYKMNWE
jgi:outer membrane protein assembly factor BamB